MKSILIQDANKVYNTVETPAVIFDKSCGSLYKIGEYKELYELHKVYHSAYIESGFQEIANNLVLMELPKEQEIVDNVFQISGYVLRILKMYEDALK